MSGSATFSASQGKGTFISPRNEQESAYRFFHVFPDDKTRSRPVSELLGLASGTATAAEAEHLGIEAGGAARKFEHQKNLFVVKHEVVHLPSKRAFLDPEGALADRAPGDEVQAALADLVALSRDLAGIEKFTGRPAPSVIT